MKGGNKIGIFLIILGVILLVWAFLSIFVEQKGQMFSKSFGDFHARTALVVYDPDPFYNLDEQICLSIAKGLSENDWDVKVVSVAAANNIENESFDLYVFCANTYNWAPDKALSNYIKKHDKLENKNVLAITLGAGSTLRSQRLLEDIIRKKGSNLIDSKSYWLLKPNDENRISESNVAVAVEMARELGRNIGKRIVDSGSM